MNKKKVAALIISGILAVGAIGGSLAWFTSKDSATNSFSTGTTTDTKDPDAGVKIDEVFDPTTADKIVPGTEVNKDVAVKSTASYPQFIRAKLTLKIKNDAGTFEEKKLTDKYNDTQTYGDIFKLKFFGSAPSFGEDGKWNNDGDYYYYMASVPGAGSTSKLLDSVTLNKDTDNTWKNKEFQVVVDAEGVQANNDAVADVFKDASSTTINSLKALQGK